MSSIRSSTLPGLSDQEQTPMRLASDGADIVEPPAGSKNPSTPRYSKARRAGGKWGGGGEEMRRWGDKETRRQGEGVSQPATTNYQLPTGNYPPATYFTSTPAPPPMEIDRAW